MLMVAMLIVISSTLRRPLDADERGRIPASSRHYYREFDNAKPILRLKAYSLLATLLQQVPLLRLKEADGI